MFLAFNFFVTPQVKVEYIFSKCTCCLLLKTIKCSVSFTENVEVFLTLFCILALVFLFLNHLAPKVSYFVVLKRSAVIIDELKYSFTTIFFKPFKSLILNCKVYKTFALVFWQTFELHNGTKFHMKLNFHKIHINSIILMYQKLQLHK